MLPLSSLLFSLPLFFSSVNARRLPDSLRISIKHPEARVTSSRSRNLIAKMGKMLYRPTGLNKNADVKKRYESVNCLINQTECRAVR